MKNIIFSQKETITTRTEWNITKELYEAILKKYNVRPCYDTKPEDITFESFYQTIIGNNNDIIWIEYDFTTTGYHYHHVDYYSGENEDSYVEAGTYTKKEWLTTFIQNILNKTYLSFESEFGVKVPMKTVEVDKQEELINMSVPERTIKYE